FLYGNALTEITTSSQTAVALTLNQAGSIVERLGIRNTGSSAPTSGAGIVVPGSQISDFRFKDVHCRGFYDGIDVQGRGFVIENYVCTRTYRYGIRVGSSSVFGDRGLGVIENVFLYQGED